jgi:hypothetical protein
MVMGGQHHAPTALTPGKDKVTLVEEAGWEGVEKRKSFAPNGVGTQDLPARSKAL